MPDNHYDTLEVSPKASAEVIRAAYKSLMQRHHPDKQADKQADAANNNERATHIAQAYAVLSDPGQRAAYDQTLSLPSLSALPAPYDNGVVVSARASTKARPARTSNGKAWYVWYAWGLIVTILVAGGVLLAQSKKRTDARPRLGDVRSGPGAEGRDGPGPAATDPLSLSTAPTMPALPGMPPIETPAQLLARTVLPYALDLTVSLPPATGTAGTSGNVLTIAELGLRVNAPEPLRWIEKIQIQRQDILRQLLAQLASARAEELTKPEADLYLKGLITSTVAKAIGLPTNPPTPPATPPVDPTQLPIQPIEVLLPQGFRLR